jgi:hypothetical protein
MGEVLLLPDHRQKLRRDPKGFLLVPARILVPLQRLEASVEALSTDTTNSKHIDWNSYYAVLAILEMSARYQ